EFVEESPYTVLVGENGPGKSNLIEALTLIFRNLDLDTEAPFDYHIKYECRAQDVEIRALKSQFPRCWARSEGLSKSDELSRHRFMSEDGQGSPLYRPAFVFGYYSG